MQAAVAIIDRLCILGQFQPAKLLRNFEAARFDAELMMKEQAFKQADAGKSCMT